MRIPFWITSFTGRHWHDFQTQEEASEGSSRFAGRLSTWISELQVQWEILFQNIQWRSIEWGTEICIWPLHAHTLIYTHPHTRVNTYTSMHTHTYVWHICMHRYAKDPTAIKIRKNQRKSQLFPTLVLDTEYVSRSIKESLLCSSNINISTGSNIKQKS